MTGNYSPVPFSKTLKISVDDFSIQTTRSSPWQRNTKRRFPQCGLVAQDTPSLTSHRRTRTRLLIRAYHIQRVVTLSTASAVSVDEVRDPYLDKYVSTTAKTVSSINWFLRHSVVWRSYLMINVTSPFSRLFPTRCLTEYVHDITHSVKSERQSYRRHNQYLRTCQGYYSCPDSLELRGRSDSQSTSRKTYVTAYISPLIQVHFQGSLMTMETPSLCLSDTCTLTFVWESELWINAIRTLKVTLRPFLKKNSRDRSAPLVFHDRWCNFHSWQSNTCTRPKMMMCKLIVFFVGRRIMSRFRLRLLNLSVRSLVTIPSRHASASVSWIRTQVLYSYSKGIESTSMWDRTNCFDWVSE